MNIKIFSLICVSVFISLKAVAHSEPTIQNTDNSHWMPAGDIKPNYPPHAIKDSITGCVRMEFTVNSEGKPVGPFKVVSVPEKVFEKVGLKAIKKASFLPSSTNPDRVAARSSIVYAFNLNSRQRPEYFSIEQCEKLTAK
jgi:TonB family protein